MSSSTGTCSVVEQTIGTVKRIKWTFVCGASSQADVIPATSTSQWYDGKILQIQTSPDSTKAPDANYDLTITDSDSVDQLLGSGANRHTSTTEIIISGGTGTKTNPLGVAINTKLALNVASGGTSGSGIVYLYIR